MEQFVLDADRLINDRPADSYHTIEVSPLTPVIGAEIGGVDLSQELPDEQLAELKRAFLAHHVLVFRDQRLTKEDHKRFARHFGELHHNQLDDGDPAVLEVSADKDSQFVSGEDWHTDGTADAEPSLGSMLYVTRTPEPGYGG
ncbi:MAG TPA: TauD/TfdA family dioxygenase, partial [Jatrophihabitans sp.]|nr:TauD/TfdA family dioxygenase [Jatrophihabitans sp.]